MSTQEALYQEVLKLRNELASRDQEIKILRKRIDYLTRKLFGSGNSEKLNPEQLQLMLGELQSLQAQLAGDSADEDGDPPESSPESDSENEPKKSVPRYKLPDTLEIEEVHITPEEVKAEPEAYKRIGEEVTEELDVVPPRFIRRIIKRGKYVRKDERASPPIVAKLPPRLIERGILSPGLIAYILVSKFCDHMPFYRQEKIFRERYGIKISRKQMCEAHDHCADWLKPIYQYIQKDFRRRSYLQADESPVFYLDPSKNQTSKGYLWAYGVPHGDVLYDWQDGTRSHTALAKFLGSFEGFLQCDGYVAYETHAAENNGVKLAHCMAHVRRKFYEALNEAPAKISPILQDIQALYHIEAGLRKEKQDAEKNNTPLDEPATRKAKRQAESKPIMTALHAKIKALENESLPTLGLGQAVQYTLPRWENLCHYLEHGELEIDNNLQENAMRPIAIGRKNWMFFGHKGTGERSAILYSLIESCRRRGIEPYAYLRDVLTRRPSTPLDKIETLIPANWQSSNPKAVTV